VLPSFRPQRESPAAQNAVLPHIPVLSGRRSRDSARMAFAATATSTVTSSPPRFRVVSETHCSTATGQPMRRDSPAADYVRRNDRPCRNVDHSAQERIWSNEGSTFVPFRSNNSGATVLRFEEPPDLGRHVRWCGEGHPRGWPLPDLARKLWHERFDTRDFSLVVSWIVDTARPAGIDRHISIPRVVHVTEQRATWDELATWVEAGFVALLR
jgi:hypothetical protein